MAGVQELYGSLGAGRAGGRRYGKHWPIFADQPFHLAGFHLATVAGAARAGEDLPGHCCIEPDGVG